MVVDTTVHTTFAAVVILAGVLASSAEINAQGRSPDSIIVAGYRLYPASQKLAGQCRRAQQHVRFTVLCPTLMPRTGDGTTPETASPLPAGDAGVPATTFAQWSGYPANVTAPALFVGGIYGGGETDPQSWSSNNPNFFFHFFVVEGALSNTQLNLDGTGTRQRFLGRRTIASHHGSLYTQLSYSLCQGACGFTGHLTFIWHQNGVTYAASLHRWSQNPLNPAVVTMLTALITHLEPT